ncbi:harmonin-binding protein USHBP1 isoform X2 [Ochotona princeps]|uniref:harmonin-binding protein USHBP1 isoform X2 n=1 Tax=Ochotona princeps TaxID=9978 RepID=UPI002714B546|nr:harmonin-binding protein USHBP1 isoform X2 [Ochotona princeps]
MSSRAARPRSRRGRHAPPVELDPVAESSEEVVAEVARGSLKLSPMVVAAGGGLEEPPLAPTARTAGQQPQARPVEAETARDYAAPEDTHAAALDAPQDVYQSLQRVLSSLEAAATAWRHPGPQEAEGTAAAGGTFESQEGAAGWPPEAAQLAERNAWLRLAVQSREDELARMRASLQAVEAEKEMLLREVQELQDSFTRLEPLPATSHSQVGGSSSSGANGEPWGLQESLSPVHPLLRRLRSDSSVHSLGTPPTPPLIPEMQKMEMQLGQLRGTAEKLKCFNRLLTAVLQGHKSHCESLSMQLDKREAEGTALQLALQYSERCEAMYRALLALSEAAMGAAGQAPGEELEASEREAWRLLAQERVATDGGTLLKTLPSPEGSSVDRPLPQEVAAQLRGLIRHLQQRRALVKTHPEPDPAAEPLLTLPHSEALLQAALEAQTGPALPRLDKAEMQRALLATRETLADLMLQVQLVRREKRGLELREAALRAQGPAHTLLRDQLHWELAQLGVGGGDSSSEADSSEDEEWAQAPAVPEGGQLAGRAWDPEKLAQEVAASLSRAADLRGQLWSLWRELEQVAQKGRARRAQSAELHSDLCKAHSALLLAFRGAHRKQEDQLRKLEQQLALTEARQAGPGWGVLRPPKNQQVPSQAALPQMGSRKGSGQSLLGSNHSPSSFLPRAQLSPCPQHPARVRRGV